MKLYICNMNLTIPWVNTIAILFESVFFHVVECNSSLGVSYTTRQTKKIGFEGIPKTSSGVSHEKSDRNLPHTVSTCLVFVGPPVLLYDHDYCRTSPGPTNKLKSWNSIIWRTAFPSKQQPQIANTALAIECNLLSFQRMKSSSLCRQRLCSR